MRARPTLPFLPPQLRAYETDWDCGMKRARRPPSHPTLAADSLARLLQSIDLRLEAYQVWSFWDEVVGESIARRAQPQRLRDGVLFVAVSSSTWMQELQFMKEEIRERLNQRLGEPLIADLFLVSGRVQPKEAAAPPPAIGPVAVPDLPPTGNADLDAALARVAQAHARRRAESQRVPKRRPRRKR